MTNPLEKLTWLESIKRKLGIKPKCRRGYQAAHQGESLEPREVLTLGTGASFAVNTALQNTQSSSANASSANGMSVVVWVHAFSGTDSDIYGQMYNANGSKRGGEFVVASSSRNEGSPSVAMDASGNFVVVWTDRFSATDSDIKMRRYSSNGLALGGVSTVSGTSASEYDPDVAMAADGRIIATYTQSISGRSNVFAKQYSQAGLLVKTINVATDSSLNEAISSVAAAADGRFAIVYQIEYSNGADSDLFLKRFSANGSLTNTHTIANSLLDEQNADVAMDDRGNSVVVWEEREGNDWDVMFRTVSSTGVKGTIGTARATFESELSPSVAMDRSDGDFVVMFESAHFRGSDLHVAEFANNGTLRRDQTVSGYGRTPFSTPSISIDGNDNYFITYTNAGTGGSDIHGRFGVL